MSHNASIASNDLQTMGGKIVPKSLFPGYVVLSFLISCIGSWTTLELLNKRTSSKGAYNWCLLVGAAIAMGGIGIWSMHFIGNRAIILGNGNIDIQITYNGGFTAISFFSAVIVLFMALAAVGANEKTDFVRLGLGGTLAGLGVCGMHYIGQAGITNYDCIYQIDYVIGSAIIAVVDATVALGVFFTFRAAWKASWWKRGICAIILAGAVSGMHWLAAVGTQYRLKQGASFASSNSRNSTIISVIVLSISGCFILLLSAIVAKAQKKHAANRATQISLTSVIFDTDGNILVKTNGLLPTKKITDKYHAENFNDEFDISHPSFLWMYRVSRNWAGFSSLVPAMREHLHRLGIRNRHGIDSEDRFETEAGTPIAEYSIIFRELFCATAAELADDMRLPLEKLGFLFDEIIHTGKKPSRGKNDVEVAALDSLGKGQLLFLIRVAGNSRVKQLQSAGYRFAPAASIVDRMSGILQIPREDVLPRLEIMREFAIDPPVREPGCHLVLFGLRASMVHGFDILCRTDARNLLPAMQLPFDTWETWMTDYIKTMETKTVAACMKLLNKDRVSKEPLVPQKRRRFAAQILHTLEALKEEIGDPIFNDAVLIDKPIKAPCRGSTPNSPPGVSTLLCFRLIIPIQIRAPGRKLDFTPLAFFKAQQHVYRNSVSHAAFARGVHEEFSPLLSISKRSSIAGGRSQKDQAVGNVSVSQEAGIANRPGGFVNDKDKKANKIELMDMKNEPQIDEGSKDANLDEYETARYVEELFGIALKKRILK